MALCMVHWPKCLVCVYNLTLYNSLNEDIENRRVVCQPSDAVENPHYASHIGNGSEKCKII